MKNKILQIIWVGAFIVDAIAVMCIANDGNIAPFVAVSVICTAFLALFYYVNCVR